ncbi:MAG: DUF5688 family protein [Clostridiales bacterium]|nr:DUF5688 family protein [Clostridiales bacterium]
MSDRINENMDLNEFCEYVKMNVKNYLPKSYQDWDINVSEIYLAGGSKMVFTIKEPDESVAPVLYLDDFYTSYKEGRELPQLMNEISDLQVQHDAQKKESPVFARDNLPDLRKSMTSWDYAKENVILDIAGCTKNADMLANFPHCKMGDIAAIYKVEVGRGKNGSYSFPITNEMKARYGVTTEELHAQASKNSMARYPAQIIDCNGMMLNMFGISAADMPENLRDNIEIGSNGMIMLSNQEVHRGASVLFYPGLLDRISDMYPEGFYIIPSSVQEIIIAPKTEYITSREMDDIIEDANTVSLKPDLQLSDFVHEYDPVSKILYAPSLAQDYKLLEVSKDDVLKPETLGVKDDIFSNSRPAAEGEELSQAVKTEQQRRTMKKHAGR